MFYLREYILVLYSFLVEYLPIQTSHLVFLTIYKKYQ